jgi:hypothetical protein
MRRKRLARCRLQKGAVATHGLTDYSSGPFFFGFQYAEPAFCRCARRPRVRKAAARTMSCSDERPFRTPPSRSGNCLTATRPRRAPAAPHQLHDLANKVLYELQERCGKRAAEVFEKDFPDTKTTGAIADYENHYSPRLNKCFIVESSTQYLRDDKGKTEKIKVLILLDVNENKAYGNFDPLQCEVRGKVCRSEAEWRELIRPYMED